MPTAKTKEDFSNETPYPVYSSQTKNNGLMGYYSEYLYEDAITWTTDGANAGTVKYRAGKFYCTNVCGVLLSENGEANAMMSEALNNIAWKYVSHVGNPKLMNNVMSEIVFTAPTNSDEQRKVSNIFLKIDELITLHQCKEIMKNIIKSWKNILQKVANDWEQRKLGELFNFRYGDGNNNPSNGGKYPVYGAGGIQGGYTKYNAENSVIIGHMGDAGCVSWGEGKHYVTYNGTITTPKNGFFSSKYGYYLLLQMDLRKYRGGSGLPFLTYDMLTEMSAIYAGDKNESRQIESILSNLDKLITLHQCKDFCRSKEKEFECIYNKDTKMTNDWEQRKLKEVANRYDNLRIPVAANLRKKGTTPYYGANGIQDYVEGYTHNGEYVLVAEDGANDLKNYPVKCVKGKIWVNNHAHVLQAISEIADNTFLTYSINQADIESLLVGGGRAKLNAEVLMGIELYFPSKEEQVIIGKYISDIDKLITLHRCKDFIPKYGKKFNMRYLKSKIKTNAWEQRKLGEIVERVVRKNINNESDLPLTISAQYGLVDQNTYFNNRVASRDVSNYYLVYNGEFAYNKSTSDGFPFGAVKRLDLYEKGVLSTLYIVFGIKNQNKVDSNYLTVFFDTDRWHKGVAERAAEGARNHGLLNISVDDFFDIDIKLPKDISEQELLGKVFYNLDKLITLHQRE